MLRCMSYCVHDLSFLDDLSWMMKYEVMSTYIRGVPDLVITHPY